MTTRLDTLFERILSETDDNGTSAERAALHAAITGTRTAAAPDGDATERFAAYLDGALDDPDTERFTTSLAGAPDEVYELEAAQSFLDEIAARTESAPADLVAAAAAGVAPKAPRRVVRRSWFLNSASWGRQFAWAGGAAATVLLGVIIVDRADEIVRDPTVAVVPARPSVDGVPARPALPFKIENQTLADAMNAAKAAAKVGNFAEAIAKAKEADAIRGKPSQVGPLLHQQILAWSQASKNYPEALATIDKMLASKEGNREELLAQGWSVATAAHNAEKRDAYTKEMGNALKPQSRLGMASRMDNAAQAREALAALGAPPSSTPALQPRQEAEQRAPATIAPPPPPPPPAPLAKVADAQAQETVTITGSLIRGTQALGVPVAGLTPGDSFRAYPQAAPAFAPYLPQNTERYPGARPNAVKLVSNEPVSTFSLDVDTASYANVRRYLNQNTLPPVDAVRVEEMVNYFDYAYVMPRDRDAPFAPSVVVYPSPWNPDTQILHVGIKGYDIPRSERPKANLVFLIDTSGSMSSPDKLPLVKRSFQMLVEQLKPEDRVSIVVYAGSAGMVLEPTPGSDKDRILASLDRLQSGGSTAGGEGIRQAYDLAKLNFDKNSVNRVILATDGDFNVGITDPNALEAFVARERSSGVFLSVLGYGGGNYNDLLMQKLAQAGNGTAAYIDTVNEARKVLVDEMSSTLFTIAKDVKVQVEFNPARVAEYRLIGYETRMLNQTDFNNDKVDAGDVGAGHTVTALYEITPVGSRAQRVDPLRYGGRVEPRAPESEIAFVKIRYKLPNEDESKLITRPVANADVVADFNRLPIDYRFVAAVAGGAQLLRHDPYIKSFDYGRAIEIAQGARGDDEFGYRNEFVQLLRLAQSAAGLQDLGRSLPRTRE